MATVVTDPETGQSYALYVDPRTGESASTPISAEQAASAKDSGPVNEYGSVIRTIDFNPITGTVGAPTLANVPKEVASSSTFKDVNTASGGQLAELYQNINSGNVVTYTGQYNTPTMYLASTGREITMSPTSTPGVYLAGLNTGGGGYQVPVTIDSKGNVSLADKAITEGQIGYVSRPSDSFFGGLTENLEMAAPYLAAGYLATQYLPGMLGGGAGAGLTDAQIAASDLFGLGAEDYAAANASNLFGLSAADYANGLSPAAAALGGAGAAGAAGAGAAGAGLGAAAGAAGAGAGLSNLAKAALVGSVISKAVTPTQKQTANPNAPDQTPVGGELSPAYQPYRYKPYAAGGEVGGLSAAAQRYNLGGYSDGGRLLKGPGDGVSDSIPATIGAKKQPARLADGEFVVPARIVSELGNGSTEAGARKLYAMMDRIQAARKKSVGKGKVAVNSRADKYLPK